MNILWKCTITVNYAFVVRFWDNYVEEDEKFSEMKVIVYLRKDYCKYCQICRIYWRNKLTVTKTDNDELNVTNENFYKALISCS